MERRVEAKKVAYMMLVERKNEEEKRTNKERYEIVKKEERIAFTVAK